MTFVMMYTIEQFFQVTFHVFCPFARMVTLTQTHARLHAHIHTLHVNFFDEPCVMIVFVDGAFSL